MVKAGRLLVGIALAIAAGRNASAESVSLFPPIEGVKLLAPTYPPPPSGPKAYSQTGTDANWSVVVWNIPGGWLPRLAEHGQGGFSSSARTASVRFDAAGANSVLALSQDGTALPCVGPSGAPLELDMFASPERRHPPLDGGPARALAEHVQESHAPPLVPLSAMTRLMFSSTLRISGGEVSRSDRCGTNLGSALVSFILKSGTEPHSRTVFYQLALGRLCSESGKGVLKRCDVPSAQRTYFHKDPYGVDDFLPALGQEWLPLQRDVRIVVDVLPRLRQALHGLGLAGDGTDTGNWFVGSVYVGQHIWGGVKLSSTWSHVGFLAETAGPVAGPR